MSEPNSLKQE